MFKLSTHPQKLGGLFVSTWQLYKFSFPKVWPWTALLIIVGIISEIFSQFELPPPSTLGPLPTPHALFWLTSLIFFILLCFLTIVLFASIGKLTHFLNGKTSAPILALRALPKVILTFLMILVLTLLFFLIMFIVPAVLLIKPIAIIFQVIGGLILFYIFFYVVSLIFTAIILDNYSIFTSIKQGFKLIWGKWWQTFIFFAAFFILIMLVSIGVSAITVGFPTHPNVFINVVNKSSVLLIIYKILMYLIQFFAMPFILCQLIVQYNNLKITKKYN